jgi:hypothetical protein
MLQSARPGPSMAVVRRLWGQLMGADRTIQIAAALGALSVILLAITVLVALERSTAGPEVSSPNIGREEQKYEREINADLAKARQAAASGHWDDAIKVYREVLDKDPINQTARQGLQAVKRAKRGQIAGPQGLLRPDFPDADSLSRRRA